MTEPNKKGDASIIDALEFARWRNRNNDNPNQKRPRMSFDFEAGKVCVEESTA